MSDIFMGDPERAVILKAYPVRETHVGEGLVIRRALPNRKKRLVGPWCFLDHFGPLRFGDEKIMDVGPHPHIGLQTVTWLIEGEVLHRDSLGYEQMIKPGQLNLMTAGQGISHSEETPSQNAKKLHGVQFWVALPSALRDCAPAFLHLPCLPIVNRNGCQVTVLLGEYEGLSSPAPTPAPIVGLEILLTQPGDHRLTLEPSFEHGLLVVEGEARLDGIDLKQGALYDLGITRTEICLSVTAPARLMLIGGEPFPDPVLMWWNFVADNEEEIRRARDDWQAGRRFGEVSAYPGGPLPAPELKGKLS